MPRPAAKFTDESSPSHSATPWATSIHSAGICGNAIRAASARRRNSA